MIRLAGWAAARPRRVIALCALLALAGAALALWRLEPSGAADTLTDADEPAFKATERYRERFGDHSIIVLVRGDLASIVLTDNLGRLLGLEGCLSGNQPRGASRLLAWRGSPCAELARTKPVQVVYGPGTFINSAVGEIQDQIAALQTEKAREAQQARDAAVKLARKRGRSPAQARRLGQQAEQLVYAELARDVATLAVRYGLNLRVPQLNDTDFVQTLVFDASRGARVPKARFAYLFPNARSAVIQVRLKPGLSEPQRRRAIALVRRAVGMDIWKLDLGVSYTVTGAPVVVDALTRSLTSAIWLLLLGAVIVMAAVLALVFKVPRLRLVPLAVALAAVACVFGTMAVVGASLTMASIAVLPVLVGLAVDYTIQLQARVEEERRRRRLQAAAAVVRAARLGGPTIGTAALATGVGFLVLVAPGVGSPIPMVRGFALLLVVGIAVALLLAFSAGLATLVVADASTWRKGPGPVRHVVARATASRLAAAGRGALALLRPVGRPLVWLGGRLRAVGRWTLRAAVRRPRRVVAIGVVLAAAGWALDTQADITSDLQKLVPQHLQAVRDVERLQDVTGVSGEIDVVVEGADLTEPAVVKWMRDYQAGLLKRFGYSSQRGCGKAAICPALSLPDLFRTAQSMQSRQRVRALLDAVPDYFSQAVITPDRKTATLAFGIRLMDFDKQQDVIDVMRDRLHPPAGISAHVAGLPVLAAQANRDLSDPWRRVGLLALGLLAVFAALLAVRRRLADALVPLIPIALATGWSALLLFAVRIPLNPMSATLGALVIAIATEFSVLLHARYRQERAAGRDVRPALSRTYASTGAAVLASGVTALAGFAVLALSDIRMLRDFGLVTVIDLGVAVLGVLAVLPAVIVLAERRAERRAVPSAAQPAAEAVHA